MENNNKGSGIFLGVIGVATLIVAIIGATFAFFGAEITGGADTLKVSSTSLALGYEDDKGLRLKTNLIPAEYWIAEYSTKTDWTGIEGNKECVDANGNEICGIYEFTIGNPSTTTAQDLYGSIKVVANDFTDLYFRIYDETGKEVVEPTAFSSADKDGVIKLSDLDQTLLASSLDKGKTPAADGDSFDETKPSTYTLVEGKDGQNRDAKNKRTYKMLIWIEETNTNQTEGNAGKSFAGSIYFTTASGTSGVTGVIAAAQKGSLTDNPDGTNYSSSAPAASSSSAAE